MVKQVVVEVKLASDGVWDLIVRRCPFCGSKHLHGGGDGKEPVLGYRCPDCNLRKVYELTLYDSPVNSKELVACRR